ncbi:zinc-ribbon domain-containing protein, partial [Arenicella sp.]|nr:zinc-ribbon domain-containing protein [Arenicella sp.]
MRFSCPSCNQPLLSPDNQIGHAATCPYCSAKFTVPSFSELESGTSTLQSSPPSNAGNEAAKDAWMAAGIGISFAVASVAVLFPFKGSYFSDLFLDRGWVPYALLLLMGWAVGILILKYRYLRIERRALLTDGLPATIGETVTKNNVLEFLTNLNSFPGRLANTIMVTRLRRGLEHFHARESNPEVASMLNMQSEIDAASNAASHTMVKVFLWAIPIMGFIGTVIGISDSVASLASGMSGADSMEGMK